MNANRAAVPIGQIESIDQSEQVTPALTGLYREIISPASFLWLSETLLGTVTSVARL